MTKSKDTGRIIVYAAEGAVFVAGIVFLILALTGNGMPTVPKGSQYSSAVSAMLFGLAPFVIEKLFKYRLPIMLHIIYLSYVIMSNIIGANLGVFRLSINDFEWYDKVMHALLGYVLCIVAIYLSIKTDVWDKSYLGNLVLIVAISMGLAALWEILEFAVDTFVPGQDMQRGSLIDTMLDMSCHFALTMLFAIQYTLSKLTKWSFGMDFMIRNLYTGGSADKKDSAINAGDNGGTNAL